MSRSSKASTFFQFKQFTVHQEHCAMKVGTDGVLLGAWTKVKSGERILDIGTGTGLVSLMLAQKDASTSIVAIDIDESATQQAISNVAQSPFMSQIKVNHISLEQLHFNQSFDLIVSNPPYFNNSLHSPDQARTLARHTQSLTLQSLFESVAKLLVDGGRFCMIYPVADEANVEMVSSQHGLVVSQKLFVCPTPTSGVKRIIWEFIKTYNESDNLVALSTLVIEEERHQYTPAFKALVKDYYLNM